MTNKLVLILGLIVLLQTSVMFVGLGKWAGPVLAKENQPQDFKVVATHDTGAFGIVVFCDPLHGNLLYAYGGSANFGNMVVLKDGCLKESIPK